MVRRVKRKRRMKSERDAVVGERGVVVMRKTEVRWIPPMNHYG